jgi:indolepyruvate ferredoxin oxidoreductase alpha subunit
VTKALLQSGVSYVGGYQGAPVSHLLDVMVQARDYMDELGVHVEACTSEASAAAMLGASINYPARGAVTWKSNRRHQCRRRTRSPTSPPPASWAAR